jgi:hypothetical protein
MAVQSLTHPGPIVCPERAERTAAPADPRARPDRLGAQNLFSSIPNTILTLIVLYLLYLLIPPL